MDLVILIQKKNNKDCFEKGDQILLYILIDLEVDKKYYETSKKESDAQLLKLKRQFDEELLKLSKNYERI